MRIRSWIRPAVALLALGAIAALAGLARGQGAVAFQLVSSAFEDGAAIPARHTCDGEDVSPPLAWSEPPEGTRSFALIVDDPDAPDPRRPRTVWAHWVVYDLPADVVSLEAGIGKAAALPKGARAGRNDWGKSDWGGPCPPVGRHRYFFKLYALDAVLGDRGPLGRHELETAMKKHVLGRAELVGTYERSGR